MDDPRPVLDYASSSVKQRRSLRWPLAIVIGGVAGFVLAQIAFEPVLRVLANGQQYAVFDVAETLHAQIRFTLGIVLGGILIAISVAVACQANQMRAMTLWALAFSAVFFIAASLGLLYARNQQSRVVEAALRLASPSTLPALLRLASAPILTAPLTGCAAVILALSTVILRRRTAPPLKPRE